MAVSTQVFSNSEFKFYINPETTIGTKNATTMQQLNVNDIVTMSHEVVQTLDVRSGSAGRVLAANDVYTRDYMTMTTVSVPLVFDETSLTELHEAALATAAVSDVITIPYNYNPDELAVGTSGITGNEKTYTVCLASPVTDESIYLTGCTISELTLTMDAGSNAGRAEGTVTFVTKFRPVDGAAAPTSTDAYGTAWKFLCDLTTKQVGGADMVLNKAEWTISNPSVYTGCGSGNPEVIARGIPKLTITGALGVKYDANTASLWETRRTGGSVAINLDGAIGLVGSYAKITGDVSPSGGDEGAFIELPLEFTASTSGSVAVFTLDA